MDAGRVRLRHDQRQPVRGERDRLVDEVRRGRGSACSAEQPRRRCPPVHPAGSASPARSSRRSCIAARDRARGTPLSARAARVDVQRGPLAGARTRGAASTVGDSRRDGGNEERSPVRRTVRSPFRCSAEERSRPPRWRSPGRRRRGTSCRSRIVRARAEASIAARRGSAARLAYKTRNELVGLVAAPVRYAPSSSVDDRQARRSPADFLPANVPSGQANSKSSSSGAVWPDSVNTADKRRHMLGGGKPATDKGVVELLRRRASPLRALA